ncbi:hypothetical protein EJ08DRAFT_655335 [Tothia fuscella]|uniref:Uncharacterized protein n=1 Tax=Tothia fuscella TaxID=1048955 RepID=A0A9P4U4R8_9PEZI|nr:hypothetical protein EJ08DRAFT_655335 [Tothia fuscella]
MSSIIHVGVKNGSFSVDQVQMHVNDPRESSDCHSLTRTESMPLIPKSSDIAFSQQGTSKRQFRSLDIPRPTRRPPPPPPPARRPPPPPAPLFPYGERFGGVPTAITLAAARSAFPTFSTAEVAEQRVHNPASHVKTLQSISRSINNYTSPTVPIKSQSVKNFVKRINGNNSEEQATSRKHERTELKEPLDISPPVPINSKPRPVRYRDAKPVRTNVESCRHENAQTPIPSLSRQQTEDNFVPRPCDRPNEPPLLSSCVVESNCTTNRAPSETTSSDQLISRKSPWDISRAFQSTGEDSALPQTPCPTCGTSLAATNTTQQPHVAAVCLLSVAPHAEDSNCSPTIAPVLSLPQVHLSPQPRKSIRRRFAAKLRFPKRKSYSMRKEARITSRDLRDTSQILAADVNHPPPPYTDMKATERPQQSPGALHEDGRQVPFIAHDQSTWSNALPEDMPLVHAIPASSYVGNHVPRSCNSIGLAGQSNRNNNTALGRSNHGSG